MHSGMPGSVVFVERSFFGVHRVSDRFDRGVRVLLHGNTVHGRQSLEAGRRREPLSYYYRTGPIGEVFETMNAKGKLRSAGLIGLGVGALTAYGEPGQQFTIYEIDPRIVRLSKDSGYFTYLKDCRAEMRFVMGDARLSMEETGDASYDLIVVDAFSSDAIPTHLMTREALELYLRKLKPGGLIAFHLSNRYLDLQEPLAYTAHELGVAGLLRNDTYVEDAEMELGKDPSRWALIARKPEDLADFAGLSAWEKLEPLYPGRGWTDDYSNVLGAWARDR
jgi:SAM-dependent methyltransferase